MVFVFVQPSQKMGAIDSNDIFAGQVQLLPAQIYTQHHLLGCKYIYIYYNDYIYMTRTTQVPFSHIITPL